MPKAKVGMIGADGLLDDTLPQPQTNVVQNEELAAGGNTGAPTQFETSGGGVTDKVVPIASTGQKAGPSVEGVGKPAVDTSVDRTQTGTATTTQSNVNQQTYQGGMIGATGQGNQTGAQDVTKATAAPDVVAQTGTANTYDATKANNSADVVAGTATAGTASATQSQINPDTDTVQGQVKGIIDANSPLMQRARQLANERSSARGMINGSIGTGAAQAALYDAATPMATSDAAAYNATRLANQSATNRASEVNATLFTDVSKFNVQSALQAGIVNKQQADAIEQFNAGQTNQASQFNAASAQDMAKFNIDNLLKAGIINQDQANRMSQFNAGEANATARQNSANATSMANAATSASATMGAASLNAQASQANAALSAQTQMALGTLDAQTRTTLANLDASNRQLLNSDNNAASLYQAGMSNIAGLQNNHNLDPAARQQAVDNQINILQKGLKLVGATQTIDLGGLLDFGGGADGGDPTADDAANILSAEARRKYAEGQTGG